MSKAENAITTIDDDATTSRRSILCAASAIAGALALPATGAAALTSTPTTTIQRLWQERETFTPEVERLDRENEEATNRLFNMAPPVPDEMRMTKIGAYMAGLIQFHRVGCYTDLMVEWVPVEGWRYAVNKPLTPAEQGPSAPHRMVTHQRARAREILPIAERYEAAMEEALVASGSREAGDAYLNAWRRRCEIEDAIIAASPETFADLLIQVQAIEARGYDSGDPEDDIPGYVGQALLRSIRALAEGHANV